MSTITTLAKFSPPNFFTKIAGVGEIFIQRNSHVYGIHKILTMHTMVSRMTYMYMYNLIMCMSKQHIAYLGRIKALSAAFEASFVDSLHIH